MTIEELYTRYRGHIMVLCRRYVRDAAEAEDVVQLIFIKAWRSLEKFQGRSGHFTWLYRIGVNECLNHLKRNRKEAIKFDESQWAVDSCQEFSPVERRELWKRVVGALNRSERKIILLYAIEGLNMVEVAQIIGISRQALYKKWNRIKAKVQNEIRGVV